MEKVERRLAEFNPKWFLVPGNHDCDFNESQTIRDKLLADLAPDEMEKEVSELVLQPLTTYFDSIELKPEWNRISKANPFVNSVAIDLADGGKLQINLINTAWMSTATEKPNSIKFPLGKLDEIPSSGCLSVTIMHHPTNWFMQPCTMRPFTEKVEAFSDIVLTGHEHCQRLITKSYDASDIERTTYLEGGVIQEESDHSKSAFNMISIDLADSKAHVSKFSWQVANEYFEEEQLSSTDLLSEQRFLQSGRRRIKDSFKVLLDSIDLPFSKTGNQTLSLQDLFVVPDLRERDRKKSHWKLVRSNRLNQILGEEKRLLFFGPEMCGKSCLAKFLFRHLHNEGKTPVLIDASILRKSKIDYQRTIRQAVKSQYAELTSDEFWQSDKNDRIIILDNLNRHSGKNGTIAEFMKTAENDVGQLVVFGGDDFWLFETVKDLQLDRFRQLEICEFASVKLKELTTKWYESGDSESDVELENQISHATKLLESVLASEVIPQYPWIITALLQKSEVSDEFESENGSFGELYRALMVAALARVKGQLDIPGQLTYLSELAYRLFKKEDVSIGDSELSDFHLDHCKKYGLPLAMQSTINELVGCGVLGCNNDEYYFKAKFSFCFFLATYFAKHVHDPIVLEEISDIACNLAHAETANTLVFLAFLSDNPSIINEIIKAVDELFKSSTESDFVSDVGVIKLLTAADVGVTLPDETPEQVRKLVDDSKDQKKLTEERNTDGRDLSVPKSNAEKCSTLEEVMASIKAIQILGQLLRNGSGSLPIARKKSITKTLFGLSRRLLGECYGELRDAEEALLDFVQNNQDQIKEDEALQTRIDDDLNRIFWLSYGVGSGVSTRVAQSAGLGLLTPTFKAVLAEDPCIPNRIFDLAIKLEHSKDLPISEIVKIHEEMKGNIYVKTLITMLVSWQLTIRNIGDSDSHKICSALGIAGRGSGRKQDFNPHLKRVGRKTSTK